MQNDNMNKNGLAGEQPVKAAWSKPEIEVIEISTTNGIKFNTPGETTTSGPS